MSRRRVLIAALLAAMTAAAGQALAQETQFSVERFRLAGDRDGLLDVEWGEVALRRSWDLGLWFGYANDPLNVYDLTGQRAGSLVADRYGGSLAGSYALLDWLQIAVDVPLVLSQESDELMQVTLGPVESFGLGDPRIAPKLELLRARDHGVGVAVIPAFTLPVASADDYFGDEAGTFAPELAVSRAVGGLRLALNGGVRLRAEQQLGDLSAGDEAFGRVGAGYRFGDPVDSAFELDLTAALAASLDDIGQRPNQNYGELLAGAQARVAGPFLVFAAGGVGLNEGYGTPDWRALVGTRLHVGGREQAAAPPRPSMRLEPVARPEPAAEPDRGSAGRPDEVADPDRDGDGVVDRADVCPDEAGVAQHQGCGQPQQVALTGDKIAIRDAIHFRTATAAIRRRSHRLLDDVAALLRAHPDIVKVRVEGHTDARGDDAANLQLSQQRAQAVVDYLVARGIAADRLEAQGFGESRPAQPNSTSLGRAANRRVEFVIVR